MTEPTIIEQTEWPKSTEAATADALIVHGARLTVAMICDNEHLMRKAFAHERDTPEYKTAMRAYIDGVTAMIGEAQVVLALAEVQRSSPEQADALSRHLFDITEDGGAIHELMWQYLTERGIDADAVWELGREAAERIHPNGSTS